MGTNTTGTRTGSLRRAAAIVASASVAASGFAIASVAPAGAQSSTTSCAEYAPVFLATASPTAVAGESIIVTGLLGPNETVTIVASVGGFNAVLGTVTAGADGSFRLETVLPAATPSGLVTITATSPNCPAPVTTTVFVTGGPTTTLPGDAACEAGGVSFAFPSTKLIDWDGYNPKVEYTPVVAVSLPAGVWNITEAISWDSYPARVNANQSSEIWEIEFLSGGTVVARSGPTQDLPDNVATAEWRGSLGSVTLPTDVDGIRARHLPTQYPALPWGEANSVYAVSATLCTDIEPGPSTSTPGTSPTTEGGAVDSSTTINTPTSAGTPTTAGLTDTVVPSVLGEQQNRGEAAGAGTQAGNGSNTPKASNLAWTGSSSGIIARLAVAMVAVGSLVMLRRRRIQPVTPLR